MPQNNGSAFGNTICNTGNLETRGNIAEVHVEFPCASVFRMGAIIPLTSPPAKARGWQPDEGLSDDWIFLYSLWQEMHDKIAEHIKKHTEDPRKRCLISREEFS